MLLNSRDGDGGGNLAGDVNDDTDKYGIRTYDVAGRNTLSYS